MSWHELTRVVPRMKTFVLVPMAIPAIEQGGRRFERVAQSNSRSRFEYKLLFQKPLLVASSSDLLHNLIVGSHSELYFIVGVTIHQSSHRH